jgi:excisionase family DNA binding protein
VRVCGQYSEIQKGWYKEMEKLLTTLEAANLLSVKPWFLIRRTKDSWQGVRLPFVRLGNRLRFRASDLESYAKLWENEPSSQSKNRAEATETK